MSPIGISLAMPAMGGTGGASTLPVFNTQPTLDATDYLSGATVTRTLGTSDAGTTITVEYFRLDATSKESEVSTNEWDTTGESRGTISFQCRVTDDTTSAFQLSNVITANLAELPAAMAADTNFTVTNDGTGGDATLTLVLAPDDGGYVSGITDYEYKIGAGSWTSAGLLVSPLSLTGLFTDGSATSVYCRAVAAGNGPDGTADSVTTTDIPGAMVADTNFTVADAATGGDATLTLDLAPAANGDTITDYEYRIGAGGSWVSAGMLGSPRTLSDLFTDGVATDVYCRAVSATGNGPDGTADSVTTTAGSAAVPDAMAADTNFTAVDANWGEATLTLLSAPSDNSSSITDYEYKIGAGSWTSAGLLASPITLTGFTDGAATNVYCRAVNGEGNGPDGTPDSVTTTQVPRQIGTILEDTSEALDEWETDPFTPTGNGPLVVFVSAMPGTFQSEDTVAHATIGTDARSQGTGTAADRTLSEFSGTRLQGWVFIFEDPGSSEVSFQMGTGAVARALNIDVWEVPGSITSQLGSENSFSASSTPQTASAATTIDNGWVMYFAAAATIDGNSITWTGADGQGTTAYSGGNALSRDVIGRVAYENLPTAGTGEADAAIGTVSGDVIVMALEVQAQITVPAQMSAPAVSAASTTSISVDRAAAPDDNGSAITSYDLRWSTDLASWTTVTGISDPETVSSLSSGTLYYVQTRAVNANGAGAWSGSGTATTTATGTAPTAASVAVGAQASDGDLAVTVTTLSEDAPDSYWVLCATEQTTITSAQVRAGTDDSDVAADDDGTMSLTQASPTASPALTTGLDISSGYMYFVFGDAGGNYSDPYEVSGVTVDTTAPTVSSVTGTKTGVTTATWAATSNEAGGTMYAAARVSTDAELTASEIENGTGDAVATSSDASPTADSANGGSFTGLTASTTYDVDVFQRDAYGNVSAVAASASTFTTDATGSALGGYDSVTTVVNDTTTASSYAGSHTTTSGEMILVIVQSQNNGGTSDPSAWTCSLSTDGAMTYIGGTGSSGVTAVVQTAAFWLEASTTGSQTITFTPNTQGRCGTIHAFDITGHAASPIAASNFSADRSDSTSKTIPSAQSLGDAGNAFISAICTKGGDITSLAQTGFTTIATGQTGTSGSSDMDWGLAYYDGDTDAASCAWTWTTADDNSSLYIEIEAA